MYITVEFVPACECMPYSPKIAFPLMIYCGTCNENYEPKLVFYNVNIPVSKDFIPSP